MEEQHTQDSNPQHNHAHKSQLELEVQHTEFATQMELKSLTQRIKCMELESGSLRMFLVSLCTSSMRLGVSFIATRQLGAVGGQLGRPNLPSFGWCTGQSNIGFFLVVARYCGGHHRTVTVAIRCAISFLFWRIRPLLFWADWGIG
jgi:hypothetical protein